MNDKKITAVYFTIAAIIAIAILIHLICNHQVVPAWFGEADFSPLITN